MVESPWMPSSLSCCQRSYNIDANHLPPLQMTSLIEEVLMIFGFALMGFVLKWPGLKLSPVPRNLVSLPLVIQACLDNSLNMPLLIVRHRLFSAL